MHGSYLKRMLAFVLGCMAIALFIATISYISPNLPGAVGEVYRNNLANDIEATALIYTESGDVADYLDTSNGKFGLKLDISGHLVKQ